VAYPTGGSQSPTQCRRGPPTPALSAHVVTSMLLHLLWWWVAATTCAYVLLLVVVICQFVVARVGKRIRPNAADAPVTERG